MDETAITAFNRTIVELKREYDDYADTASYPFNRTIVELKQNKLSKWGTDSSPLIEPLWN